MKTGFRVFAASLIGLGLSWCGFVLAPVMQLGGVKQTTVLNSSEVYPVQRSGDATLGLQVYRSAGCAACHTTQLQQTGVACEVSLTSLGKNQPEEFKKFIASLLELPPYKIYTNAVAQQLRGWDGALPKTIFPTLDKTVAEKVADYVNGGGCKAEIHIVATGGDMARGWGVRRSVAEDFLWDHPVQLGDLRVGPDLANVGNRWSSATWQLLHLYAPQAEVKNSAMPPFRFLFETKKKTAGEPASPDALPLPEGMVPNDVEVIPTEDAKNLAAYLLSLRADVPLHDAPFTQAAETKK